jgi:chlorobactene glucosyltransferase
MIALGALLVVGQLCALFALLFNRAHTKELDAPADRGTRLTVIVPARNEENNIGECLRALLASEYSALSVVVVDDSSSDRTAEIARELASRDARLQLVAAGALPAGWLGKNHALFVGTRGVTSDFLLFVDADLRVAPDCIARAVCTAERSGADLLCLVPATDSRSFWEDVVQSLIVQLICTVLPAREINNPDKPHAAGTGPFLLFRRSAYERIGGHEAVRDQVVEDLRLAEEIKKNGQRLLLTRSRSARLRMYDSLHSIVAGWSKNFHVALGRAQWAAPLVGAALIFFYTGPLVATTLSLVRGDAVATGLAGCALALQLGGRVAFAVGYGAHLRRVLWMPFGALIVAWILVRSAVLQRAGATLEWKGRTVAQRSPKSSR